MQERHPNMTPLGNEFARCLVALDPIDPVSFNSFYTKKVTFCQYESIIKTMAYPNKINPYLTFLGGGFGKNKYI